MSTIHCIRCRQVSPLMKRTGRTKKNKATTINQIWISTANANGSRRNGGTPEMHETICGSQIDLWRWPCPDAQQSKNYA
ncbi:hypothetical protein Bca52824_016996 [Brassica carinata]|uniref:Uncharacterized protein n=1 Tax=Brassica carinata TaxID=52824 RepID=A0A8X7VLU7_BRACI|nr:hypothetical protein Bca52824_016996 [Brassica carinata]